MDHRYTEAEADADAEVYSTTTITLLGTYIDISVINESLRLLDS